MRTLTIAPALDYFAPSMRDMTTQLQTDSFRWSDATTPRTDKPVRFRFYASRCDAWQGFPLTIQVPRLRV